MFAKNYHLYWIIGRTNILCDYLINIFFLFWARLLRLFFYVFPEAPASYDKKELKDFLLHCTFTCMSSKTVPGIFKILFQTGDINIFVLRGVFFSRYVQLKSSFSDKKNISSEI